LDGPSVKAEAKLNTVKAAADKVLNAMGFEETTDHIDL
jgi:hypothetical protein